MEKVSVLEYRCKICKLQYFTGLLDSSLPENAELGSQKMALQTQTPEADASEYRIEKGADSAKSTTKVKKSTPDETPRLDPLNSALVRWRPQPYDPRDLVNRWERAHELAEMKFFKRVHIKLSKPETVGYFKKFFRVERELGRGGRGVVLLVEHVLDGVALGHFACKRVPVGDDHAWLEKVLVELQLLTQLSHQNLVSYRHIWLEDVQLNAFSPSVSCAFILQQYCNGGDLHEYIYPPAWTTTQQLKERFRRRSRGEPELPGTSLNKPRRLKFEEIYSFFKDVTAGVQHLHQHGYIHRDLKPTHCLLHTVGNKTRVLVSDFGEVQYGSLKQKSTGATGTISYYAPEVLRQTPREGPFFNFTTKSDIFSLGMILSFLCFANLPYISANVLGEGFGDLDQLIEKILSWAGFDDEGRLRPDLPNQLYLLLRRLLSVDPDVRPPAEEVHRSMDPGRPSGLLPQHGRRRGSAGRDSEYWLFSNKSHVSDDYFNMLRTS